MSIIDNLAKMQVGCPSLSINDWAKDAREKGEAIPSAHVCIAWVEHEVKQVEDDLTLALDLLEKRQWGSSGYVCDVCEGSYAHHAGHIGDCQLARLLADNGREVRWAS